MVAVVLLGSCGGEAAPLAVERLEVRMAPVAAVSASGYFILQNRGAVADTLDAVASEGADSVTLHASMPEDGGQVMMMPLSWIAIPAGDSVVFAPGGRHLMLERFTRSIAPGDSLPVSFHFRSGRVLKLAAPVRAVAGPE
jgi:copper(I)-binding protein